MRRCLFVGFLALFLLAASSVSAQSNFNMSVNIPQLWDDNGVMKIPQGQPFYVEIIWDYTAPVTDSMLGGSFRLEFYSPDIATVTKVDAPTGAGRAVLPAPYNNVALKNGFDSETLWNFFGRPSDWPYAFQIDNFDGTLPDHFGHAFATTAGFPPNLGATAFYEVHYRIDAPGTFCIDTLNTGDPNWDWAFGDDRGADIPSDFNNGNGAVCFEVKDPALDVRQQSSELLPIKYALEQNHPNPFNPSTVIEFALPKASVTNLSIFNILGQRIATLVDKELPAGFYQVTWDGTSDNGSVVATGIYFYRIEAGKFQSTKKLMFLK